MCGSDAADALPPGRYEAVAVIAISSDEGTTIVMRGGPWPIELG